MQNHKSFAARVVALLAVTELAGAVDSVTEADYQARFRFHGVLTCEKSCVENKIGWLRIIRTDSDGTVVTSTVIYEAPVSTGQYVEVKKDYYWGDARDSRDPSVQTQFSFLIVVGDCESKPQNIDTDRGIVDIDIGPIITTCKTVKTRETGSEP